MRSNIEIWGSSGFVNANARQICVRDHVPSSTSTKHEGEYFFQCISRQFKPFETPKILCATNYKSIAKAKIIFVKGNHDGKYFCEKRAMV